MSCQPQQDPPALSPVVTHREGSLLHLQLNRPERRNALSLDMLSLLLNQLTAASEDTTIRAVLFSATAPVFCAGMDLKSTHLADSGEARAFAEALAAVYRALLRLPVPLICAVDGPVRGGGLGLVGAADVVWASKRASFALPEVRLGLVPVLVSRVLLRRCSSARLSWLAISSESIAAQQAADIGLVDQISETSALEDGRRQAEALIHDASTDAIRRTKAILGSPTELDEDQLWRGAIEEFVAVTRLPSTRRGLEHFSNKTTLDWETVTEDPDEG